MPATTETERKRLTKMRRRAQDAEDERDLLRGAVARVREVLREAEAWRVEATARDLVDRPQTVSIASVEAALAVLDER